MTISQETYYLRCVTETYTIFISDGVPMVRGNTVFKLPITEVRFRNIYFRKKGIIKGKTSDIIENNTRIYNRYYL